MSSEEVKAKVDLVLTTKSVSSYMVTNDVKRCNVIIAPCNVHARTLVNESQFRSYIRLILRLLIDDEQRSRKAEYVQQLTAFVWKHSAYNKELLEEIHIADFLCSLGITKSSLPRNHRKFGDQYKELIERITLVSLELVYRIPLCMDRKPGVNQYSWFNQLNHLERQDAMKSFIKIVAKHLLFFLQLRK